MRCAWVILLAPALAAAQGALVSGVLLERDAPAAEGELSVRTPSAQVFRYRFDSRTYVEREKRMIDVAGLQPGDTIEVVSEPAAGSALRYAMTVHVLPSDKPPVRALTAGRYRVYSPPRPRAIPTGSLSYSGVVYRLSPESLVLRMRGGGDQTILLRQDTRYLDDGDVVTAASLRPNMMVFVRAGKTLYGEVEAYQVVWGTILRP